MSIGFWDNADCSKYRAAYFERGPVWCHGNYARLTEHDGVIIYGRSDATLIPGGVRIGTAEIYRQVDQLPEVQESICIGQDWQDDVRVVLFVRLREGLAGRRTARTHQEADPRQQDDAARAAKILQVDDNPRTISGKIVELAVRNVVHGCAMKNTYALANPQALELYRDRAELSV